MTKKWPSLYQRVSLRIKTTWHVLRGRPTIAYCDLETDGHFRYKLRETAPDVFFIGNHVTQEPPAPPMELVLDHNQFINCR